MNLMLIILTAQRYFLLPSFPLTIFCSFITAFPLSLLLSFTMTYIQFAYNAYLKKIMFIFTKFCVCAHKCKYTDIYMHVYHIAYLTLNTWDISISAFYFFSVWRGVQGHLTKTDPALCAIVFHL